MYLMTGNPETIHGCEARLMLPLQTSNLRAKIVMVCPLPQPIALGQLVCEPVLHSLSEPEIPRVEQLPTDGTAASPGPVAGRGVFAQPTDGCET